MIDANEFVSLLEEKGISFFAGVPDSLLKHLCACINRRMQLNKNHFITPNEGLAVSLASGYFLSTGKIPAIYMQNSGLGNIVNPVTSLTNDRVYGIPMIYIIGWRGQPGKPDEPQHLKQGEITPGLLNLLGISWYLIDGNSTIKELNEIIDDNIDSLIESGHSMAFLVEKNTFSTTKLTRNDRGYTINREEAISQILSAMSENDVVVSTTGKISREIYEYRKNNKLAHYQDFLTVGSMGHSSSIALGIAISDSTRRVYCFDGDGAALMHMGSMALIGSTKPSNYIHIILNNSAYESVGGQPSIACNIEFSKIGIGCGYRHVEKIDEISQLNNLLERINLLTGPILIDIHVKNISRSNLLRPESSPWENKLKFMNFLNQKKK